MTTCSHGTISNGNYDECCTGNIVIDPSLEFIKENAFQGCNLTTVTFLSYSNLTYIDGRAFQESTIKGDLYFPPSLRNIKHSAFYRCRGLESINFPVDSMLETIDEFAFDGTSLMTTINIPATVPLRSIGYSAFYASGLIGDIFFPPSLKEIGHHAFEKCSNVTNIFFVDNTELQGIGPDAFIDTNINGVVCLPAHCDPSNSNNSHICYKQDGQHSSFYDLNVIIEYGCNTMRPTMMPTYAPTNPTSLPSASPSLGPNVTLYSSNSNGNTNNVAIVASSVVAFIFLIGVIFTLFYFWITSQKYHTVDTAAIEHYDEEQREEEYSMHVNASMTLNESDDNYSNNSCRIINDEENFNPMIATSAIR